MGEAEAGVGFGDADELVVFRDAFATRERTGFDLAGAEADGEVSDGDIFGFTGTVRHDSVEASALSKHDSVDGLGEGADLVGFDEDGVATLFVDAALEEFGVGHEEVVAD